MHKNAQYVQSTKTKINIFENQRVIHFCTFALLHSFFSNFFAVRYKALFFIRIVNCSFLLLIIL